MSWVKEFYVDNAGLYGSAILSNLWDDGKKTAGALKTILDERKIPAPQSNVLDVPCGNGRIAIPLAKFGMRVTGVDLSPAYIRIAKESAAKQRVQNRTNFLVGRAEKLQDVLQKKGIFDAAINIHTNLGYGSTRDDEAFLRATRDLVKDGGVFLITSRRNEKNVLTNLQEATFLETESMLVLQNNRYVQSQSRLYTTWRFFRKSRNAKTKLSRMASTHLIQVGKDIRTGVRLYSNRQLIELLDRTGWRLLEWGETIICRTKPVSEDSATVYFLCEKSRK